MASKLTSYYTRSLKPKKHSFFLLGPRGTGKSTWINIHYKGAKVINLLDEELYQNYLADISLFYHSVKTLKPHSWVVVDEIQRLPQLLNEVHRLMEEQKLKFVLTGSSARKLRRKGVNLLGGRAYRHFMYPFTPKELGKDFTLNSILQYGSIPLVQMQKDKKNALISYVQMYLKEEIREEALVRNLSGFVRCLPVLALYHGQVINISSTARDAGVTRSTIKGFIEILEDTLLLNVLPAFEAKLRVRERKHPKIYWVDPGLVRACKKQLGPLSIEEKGSLFEGFVYMCLKVKMEYENFCDEIYYWSSARGTTNCEVDFLLKRGKEFTAIEVKTTKKVRSEDLKGLKAIAELKGVKQRLLVYLGHIRLKKEGVEIVPFSVFCEEFLSS